MTLTVLAVQSFQHQVGKSCLATNLALHLALTGCRVAILDLHFECASAHQFYDIQDVQIKFTLNDVLLDRATVEQAAYPILPETGNAKKRCLYLLPASTRVNDIVAMLRHRLTLDKLDEILQQINRIFQLDVIILDTRAGLDSETLAYMALCNLLLMVVHPDERDFEGAAVMVDISRQLKTPQVQVVLNGPQPGLERENTYAQLEQTYHCPVAGILDFSQTLGEQEISPMFIVNHPEDAYSRQISEMAAALPIHCG